MLPNADTVFQCCLNCCCCNLRFSEFCNAFSLPSFHLVLFLPVLVLRSRAPVMTLNTRAAG